jgi:hypothetical protein
VGNKMTSLAIDQINKAFLKEWDPIGTSDTPGAEDEYSSYAHDIYKLIEKSYSYTELFEYLWELETIHMGLKGNEVKTKLFAQNLFNQIKSLLHSEKFLEADEHSEES